MPRRLAREAGRVTGRAGAMGRIWERDRAAAIQIGIEEMRADARLNQMQETLKRQTAVVQARTEEAETIKMRNALSTELGVQSATSGKSIEDLGDAVNDPRTVLAYSETKREMAKAQAKQGEKAGGALYRSFAGGMRAEIADIAVDVNDPTQVQDAVNEIFDKRRQKAAQMTAEEISEGVKDDWQWTYKQIVDGMGDPAILIGGDPELKDAYNPDAEYDKQVDWPKLRELLKQKWARMKGGTVTTPTDNGPNGADEWINKKIKELNLPPLKVTP